MKFLPLIWKNLLRRKVRTLFTMLSIVVAFVLFCVLAAIRVAFGGGIEVAGADRLLVIHKISLVQFLPESYRADIEAIDGVVDISHQTWFGGIYQQPSNFFPQFAVDPESYLRLYPEIVLSAEEREGWLRNRAGAIVGRSTADRFGWEVGDRIPLQGALWRNEGALGWEFVIEGVYEAGAEGFDTSTFYLHHDYLTEGSPIVRGAVGLYVLRIADPAQAADVAAAIDLRFANSPAETRTSSEQAFLQGLTNQVGNVGAVVTAVLSAVFFTIVIIAANTMVQAVRERTGELAVLKTLGFTDGGVLALVMAESLILVGAAGGLGLWLGHALVGLGDPTGGFMPTFLMPRRDIAVGVLLVIGLGLAAGAVPAWAATRLRIVDALRRV